MIAFIRIIFLCMCACALICFWTEQCGRAIFFTAIAYVIKSFGEGLED
jgi:hypothetical protein